MPKSTLPPITGNQAREARKSLQMSQADVASAIGIPRPTYSLFESGRYRLDDRQQRKLRECLADVLSDAPQDDPEDDDQPARAPPARRQAAPPRTGRVAVVDDPPEPETPVDQAGAALDELRELARRPGGLRLSSRSAQAIEDAEAALEALDYSELLELAEDREVILPKAQPDVDTLHRMEQKDVLHWETSLRAQLICKALYGPHLQGCDFDALDQVEDQLQKALPKEDISTGVKTDIWGDPVGEKDAHLRRAKLAPHIVEAAKKRAAPILEGVGTMGA